jgi:hypothetical protein
MDWLSVTEDMFLAYEVRTTLNGLPDDQVPSPSKEIAKLLFHPDERKQSRATILMK